MHLENLRLSLLYNYVTGSLEGIAQLLRALSPPPSWRERTVFTYRSQNWSYLKTKQKRAQKWDAGLGSC